MVRTFSVHVVGPMTLPVAHMLYPSLIVLCRSMLPDVVDEASLKMNVRREEMLYAFFVFGAKFASGITLALSTGVYKYEFSPCCFTSLYKHHSLLTAFFPPLNFCYLIHGRFVGYDEQKCVLPWTVFFALKLIVSVPSI